MTPHRPVTTELRPVTSRDQIREHIHKGFLTLQSKNIRLIGILFARPTSPLAKDQVIPNLAYFNNRSGNHIDFYCGGYWEGQLPPDTRTGRIQLANGWMYSDKKFDEFRQEIESQSLWKYSGGVDLILINARRRTNQISQTLVTSVSDVDADLDFSSAISASLDAMIKEGAIQSVETFFEQVFRYAENQSGTDPTWGFSNQAGFQIGASALKKLLLSFLPKWASDDANKAFHFAVRDISKEQSFPFFLRS